MSENAIIREFCQLDFATSLGNTRSIRIPDPGTGISTTSVTQAASRFIAANPFDETVGSITQLTNAYILKTTRIPLFPTA